MTDSTHQQWTDYVEADDVRRKFLKCECGQNGENLFYVYEQKPGLLKKRVCLHTVRSAMARFASVWVIRDEGAMNPVKPGR